MVDILCVVCIGTREWGGEGVRKSREEKGGVKAKKLFKGAITHWWNHNDA